MTVQKIRWGILGCASIAKGSVIPGIKRSKYNEIRAIASRSLDNAQTVAKEFDIPVAYGSYEQLIADPELDAIYIPLPNHLHKSWTIAAAKAGKHVLCEKPIALNAQEAEEMLAAARESGVIVAEAFMYRYQERFRNIKKVIANGDIGELRLIRGSLTFNNGDSTENVRFVKEWGGGSLYDVGCYPISAARYLLENEPLAITMHGLFSEKHGGVDMMASGLVEFPDDVTLLFDGGMWAHYRNSIEIVGTKGRIEVPEPFSSGHKQEVFIIHNDQGVQEVQSEIFNNYALQADAIAEAIRGIKPLQFPLEDSIANMKVLEAGLLSAELKTRIAIEQ